MRRHVSYRTGPFPGRLKTNYAPVVETLIDLYPGTIIDGAREIIDYDIELLRPLSPRRWVRPYIRFGLEGLLPFEPYPLDHAFPLLEWGLNWSIATSAHHHLMFHAAAMERDGRALLLPAVPGSGKSTLSAALAHRGWRLLSDEFGLIAPTTGQVVPLPRAVALKNASIDIIKRFAPEAHLGPVFPKTRKGDVAHMRPPGGEPATTTRTRGAPLGSLSPLPRGSRTNAAADLQIFGLHPPRLQLLQLPSSRRHRLSHAGGSHPTLRLLQLRVRQPGRRYCDARTDAVSLECADGSHPQSAGRGSSGPLGSP